MRPIIMSGPMVRAILDGRKTQTRRVAEVTSEGCQPGFVTPKAGYAPRRVSHHAKNYCPYGCPGDLLWVRETHRLVASGEVRDGYGEVRYGVAYRADSAVIWRSTKTVVHDLTGQKETGPMQFDPPPWRPSIHMPRRASRLTLRLTNARLERLQEISDSDAEAEGFPFEGDQPSPRDSFSALWDSLNAKRGHPWESNPWVWRIAFEPIHENVDAVMAKEAA